MGKTRSISLATRSFDKAGDATAFFAAMLNRYGIGDLVSAEDAAQLSALLERHDERDDKIGAGIGHFKVDRAPDQYGGQCFWIVRIDGTVEDFSYVHCLKRKSYD